MKKSIFLLISLLTGNLFFLNTCLNGPGSDLTIEEFMEDSFSSYCDYYKNCCTDQDLQKNIIKGINQNICENEQNQNALIEIMKDSWSKGWLEFNAEIGEYCRDEITLYYSQCHEEYNLLEDFFDVCDKIDVAHAFRPHQEAGEQCNSDMDCVDGWCHSEDKVCITFKHTDEDCTHSDRCIDGFVCDTTNTNKCVSESAKKDDGEICLVNQECSSGFCDGTCQALCVGK